MSEDARVIFAPFPKKSSILESVMVYWSGRLLNINAITISIAVRGRALRCVTTIRRHDEESKRSRECQEWLAQRKISNANAI